MSYRVKFGICVGLGFIGFYFVMARMSIESLIGGFLLVAVAVLFGHYFWARMHQAKNPMSDEIAALIARNKHDNDNKIN